MFQLHVPEVEAVALPCPHEVTAYDVPARVLGPDLAVLLVVGEPGACTDLPGAWSATGARTRPSSVRAMDGGSLTETYGSGLGWPT